MLGCIARIALFEPIWMVFQVVAIITNLVGSLQETRWNLFIANNADSVALFTQFISLSFLFIHTFLALHMHFLESVLTLGLIAVRANLAHIVWSCNNIVRRVSFK